MQLCSFQEDFKAIQFELELEDVFLLHHVSSRWLSLLLAVTRILSQWTALSSYFKHLTDNDKTVGSNDNYKAIMHLMDNPSVFLQLLFIADIAPIFSDFLRFFQTEGPLVHLLHSALSELIRKLLLRFVTTAAVGTKTGERLTAESKQRIILQGSGNLLKEAESKLSEAILLGDMDKIYIANEPSR